METFIWTIVAILALETVGRLMWLSAGYLPERTAGGAAFDALFGFVFIAWGLVVLLR